ncbi:hypothetical protein C482_07886 [Natrialba chahannaoensis JCM 10990]|uniref:ChsH2 rubredoxin-like zinc ribbon domain-containing protein n=1 Tax=Natrialba chahannaoensis JCM 10990 TaxID=1227492 RepID=M0AUR1_9EURY|nr:zinc ribbon domain-containing protein [Natrialba chahannaoensis]ELZ01104.1 hypothetical protein C482_07886 [Natrialba chahannaoensis JCM 10990]
MAAITAVGAYAPRFRITAEEFADAWGHFQASGISEKAVPAADEDALTMGYEAATRALEAAELTGDAIDWLAFASSHPPVAEEDLTARLGAMLAVNESATRHVFTGSTRAGTRALWAGMDAVDADETTTGLVVAADAPVGEPDSELDHAAGAGAAAFALEASGPADIVDRAEHSLPYPGTRFRNTGEEDTQGLGVTQYDRQAFTETIGGAVDALESDSSDDLEPASAAIQAPNGKLPYRAAGAAGVGTDEIQAAATVHDLGDLGAASVPVSLASALAEDHESILGVSFGSGAGADALVLECSGSVPAQVDLETDTNGADDEQTLSYAEYLRQRGVVTAGPPSGGGAYVSVPSWRRSIPQRYRLEAGRCPECGALSFPPEGACDECGSLAEYEAVELADTGRIEAVTTISQGGAPPEFAPQQSQAGDYAAAIVELPVAESSRTETGEGTVSLPAMGTDAAPDAFAVDDEIETTIRRIYTQEGVTRYGFKVRPAA